jgi:hypothetical protein
VAQDAASPVAAACSFGAVVTAAGQAEIPAVDVIVSQVEPFRVAAERFAADGARLAEHEHCHRGGAADPVRVIVDRQR